jgi:hypothetical protein
MSGQRGHQAGHVAAFGFEGYGEPGGLGSGAGGGAYRRELGVLFQAGDAVVAHQRVKVFGG